MTISRRNMLGSAGIVASLAGLATVPTPVAAQAPLARPKTYPGLSTAQEIWEELLFMVALGSRNTGFPGHVKFVDRLAGQLQAIPGMSVHRDGYKLPRWDATHYALTARPVGGQDRRLHATSAYPYSGKTGSQGVTGKIVDLGTTLPNEAGGSEPVRFGDIRGKIVFLRSPVHGFPYGDNFHVMGANTADVKLPDRIKEAIWQNRSAPDLDQFAKAGAAGVILSWVGVSDANAEGQYAPFGHKFAECPALWVGEKTGEEIAKIAAAGGEATIVLEADIFPNTPTDTVYGVLPGKTDEVVFVHTHSDGPNACEENGGIGVVALAKFLAARPKGSLNKTYIFTLTTGHMAGAYVRSFREFIDAHPDIMKKAVAALVLEHLGCRSWVDRDGAYVPSGYNQATMVLTQSKPLGKIVLEEVAGTIEDRVTVVDPYMKRFTGESANLITYGVPTIGIMPAPSYLLKESENGGIERHDARLYRTQIENFSRMLLRIDAMSKKQLSA